MCKKARNLVGRKREFEEEKERKTKWREGESKPEMSEREVQIRE